MALPPSDRHPRAVARRFMLAAACVATAAAAGVAFYTAGSARPGPAADPDDEIPVEAREGLRRAVARVVPDGGAEGWGVLLDPAAGLVVTAGVVVGDRDAAAVAVGSDPSRVAARVVSRDAARGLVVLRLDRPPVGDPPSLGGTEIGTGDVLYTVRGPAGGEREEYTRAVVGHVIQVPHLCGTGPRIVPWVLRLDPPEPFCDPGAPVVDGRGRLVAVAANENAERGPSIPTWLIDTGSALAALGGRINGPAVVCPPPPE